MDHRLIAHDIGNIKTFNTHRRTLQANGPLELFSFLE